VLNDEPLSIVAGPNHPLAQAKCVQLESLMDYPWVLLPRDSPLRELVEREFERHDLPLPFMPVETPSMFATIALLQHTDMISAMPTEVAHLFASDQLLSLLPVHLRSHIAPYGLITRKGASLSPAVQVFISMLHDVNIPRIYPRTGVRQTARPAIFGRLHHHLRPHRVEFNVAVRGQQERFPSIRLDLNRPEPLSFPVNNRWAWFVIST
jgi:hypothetical protein